MADTRSHFERFISFFPGDNTFQIFGEKQKLTPMVLENATPALLMEKNRLGYGIFICVNKTNGKGRSASNIKQVRYVFADLDGVSCSKMMNDLPNFAVQSSPGKFHGYWAVDSEFPLDGFKHVQKAIAYKYKSDQSVNDLPRVMRVAGFMHQKGEPCRTEITFIDQDKPKPLSYAECFEKWPPAPKKQWNKKPQKTNTESFDVGESVTDLLLRFGWTYFHGPHWTRPGKDHGISGTIMESGMFYVFTDETCLKPNAASDAFEILAQYEFSGDKKACAKYVMEKRR